MIREKLSYLKKVSLPGFNKVPIYNVLRFILEEVGQDSIHNRASAAAFNILLASFPTLLLFYSIIAYVPIDGFRNTLLDFIMYLLPLNAQTMARKTIDEIIINSSGSSGFLSFGVLLTLYFASNGVRSLMLALSGRTTTIFYQRNFFRRVMVSMALTLVLCLIVIISVVGILVGQYLIDLLIESVHAKSSFAVIGLQILQILTAFSLTYNIVALIYWLAPVVERVKWGYFSPGAVLTAFSTILFLKIFSYFVNTFGNYDRLYGSLGASMVLLICFYGIALVLIIGFELNVGIKNSEKQGELEKTE